MKKTILKKYPLLITIALSAFILYIAPILFYIFIAILIALPIYLAVRLFGGQ
jgi:hypothetical protein|tara:strand:+ start:949 stop:1104 length:156 start_codon:yes stop_codon:yes gene_type:complete